MRSFLKILSFKNIFLFLFLFYASSCQQQKQVEVGEFSAWKQNEIISPKAKHELLWRGGKFTEGPTIAKDGSVLFTDIPRNLIMRYDQKSGKTSVWRKNTGSANGLKFSEQGDLLICEGADKGGRRLSMVNAKGEYKVIAGSYMGKKFNSPNDVDVAPNGDMYFTDPRYTGNEKMEIPHEGIYIVRNSKVEVVSSDVEKPNGILVSRDGKFVFVADNNHHDGGKRTLERFDITPSGKLINKKTLYSFRNNQRGFDGMAFDIEGNIYATAGLGKYAAIYVFSPSGEQLAFIKVYDNPTNCIFGGPDEPYTLYYTAQVKTDDPKAPMDMGLYRVKLKKMGHRLFPH